MKIASTLLLKVVIAFIGFMTFIFCLLVFPIMWRSENIEYLPIFLVVQLSALPVFFALYQAFRLLIYIDQNKAFSDLSVKAIKYIKYCGILFGVIYTLGLPYIYYRAEVDDAPGPLAISLILIFASSIVVTFAAVLQRILQDALTLKSENDLTV